MTIYAIGDIHGCSKPFDDILEKINFDLNHDQLWLVGDLVNRGKNSLKVIKKIISLKDNVKAVLGNHDLYLLSVLAEITKLNTKDSFDNIIQSPDRELITNWLRGLPLIHWDKQLNKVLVHAGIPPKWTINKAFLEAELVCNGLKGSTWKEILKNLFGNEPISWSDKLDQNQKNRYIINALTRMRFCNNNGSLSFDYKCPPGMQPDTLIPWFNFPNRPSKDTHIIFGHWSSLGLVNQKNISSIDTGCVWGRYLTALPVHPKGNPIKIKCNGLK